MAGVEGGISQAKILTDSWDSASGDTGVTEHCEQFSADPFAQSLSDGA